MKKISIITLFLSVAFIACKKNSVMELPEDTIGKTVDPVTKLKVLATSNEKELAISWTNPADVSIIKAEISYRPTATGLSASPNPAIMNVIAGSESAITIRVPAAIPYTISVVLINQAGAKSAQSSAVATPYNRSVADLSPMFLRRADTLMTSMVKLYLDGMPRDIWSSNYPRTTGFWDGAAVIWGHGGAFSGYAALKEAAQHYPAYKSKIETQYDNRLLKAIDDFRNTRNGRPEAYAVYPGDGDERYYDDNIWVGIDMVDLYMLTKSPAYLTRAKIVWNFVLAGTDLKMGGGVYWKEDGNSKNTCSTAPAAVLAAKLYQATNEVTYLNSAKSLYTWVKSNLQDPSDYLYWDNVRLTDDSNPNSPLIISKEKYTYNSGQPMQIAALLYKITGEAQYLTDAQNIAKSAYKRWFIPFNSYTLGESFRILEPGHVWFQAIMFRGFIELYRQDGNATYVNAYKKTLANAWLSSARNKSTHLIKEDFRGGSMQTSFDILHQGACLEMLSRLASLEHEGL